MNSAYLVALSVTLIISQVSQSDAPTKTSPKPPPPRARSEIERVLGKSISKSAVDARNDAKDSSSKELRQLHVLLLDAKKDHGSGEHDYPAWKKKWSVLFGKLPKVSIDTAYEWPTDKQLDVADLVICYYWNHDWSPARYRALDAYLKRGGGLVMLHSAVIADRAAEQLAGRIGLAFQPDRMKYRHGELDLKIELRDHPILRGLPASIHFHDESYWPPLGDLEQVHVLATAVEEEKAWPILWTHEPNKDEGGKGRVFCSVLGHYSWTFEDPLFRVIILRGAAWAAREPIDRFAPLAVDGVTFSKD